MASANEENKRKQKRKQYLIDFLLYRGAHVAEREDKSKIAFYDDYDRAFVWINYEVRQAPVKPDIEVNIPDKVIGNYVIIEPLEYQARVMRKFRKSKKEEIIMITSY